MQASLGPIGLSGFKYSINFFQKEPWVKYTSGCSKTFSRQLLNWRGSMELWDIFDLGVLSNLQGSCPSSSKILIIGSVNITEHWAWLRSQPMSPGFAVIGLLNWVWDQQAGCFVSLARLNIRQILIYDDIWYETVLPDAAQLFRFHWFHQIIWRWLLLDCIWCIFSPYQTAQGKATSQVLRLCKSFRTKDSSFSYRQDQVARLGERARPETTEEDRSGSDGENLWCHFWVTFP